MGIHNTDEPFYLNCIEESSLIRYDAVAILLGALHVVCPPLLAAQPAATGTKSGITGSRKRRPLKVSWRKGTYNVESMGIVCDVCIRQEARGLSITELLPNVHR